MRQFGTDRRGVAAIEFALIAPILFILYFLTMEVSQAIETNRKVSRVSSMVADLITQQSDGVTETTANEVDAVMRIGEAILQPYNRTKAKIEVTALEIKSPGSAKIIWSRSLEGDNAERGPKGSTVHIPSSYDAVGQHLVKVTARLDYEPVIIWTAQQKASLGLMAAFDGIQMGETEIFRPRSKEGIIECRDC